MIPANDSRSPNRIRLDAAEAKLKAQGAVGFRFSFDRSGEHPKTLDGIVGEAATILEAIGEGRFAPMKPFGDSRRLRVVADA